MEMRGRRTQIRASDEVARAQPMSAREATASVSKTDTRCAAGNDGLASSAPPSRQCRFCSSLLCAASGSPLSRREDFCSRRSHGERVWGPAALPFRQVGRRLLPADLLGVSGSGEAAFYEDEVVVVGEGGGAGDSGDGDEGDGDARGVEGAGSDPFEERQRVGGC